MAICSGTLQPKKTQEVPWRYAVVPCSQARVCRCLRGARREAQRGPDKLRQPQRGTETHREAQRGLHTYMILHTYIRALMDLHKPISLHTDTQTCIHTYTHTSIHTLHRGNYMHRGPLQVLACAAGASMHAYVHLRTHVYM